MCLFVHLWFVSWPEEQVVLQQACSHREDHLCQDPSPNFSLSLQLMQVPQSCCSVTALAITTPTPLSGSSCIMENVSTWATCTCVCNMYMYDSPLIALYIPTGTVAVYLISSVPLLTTLGSLMRIT
jgi:hypothetical protein